MPSVRNFADKRGNFPRLSSGREVAKTIFRQRQSRLLYNFRLRPPGGHAASLFVFTNSEIFIEEL